MARVADDSKLGVVSHHKGIQIVREIGKGAFGTVFLVKHRDEHTGDVIPLVLKKVKLAGQNARERHACLREMSLISSLAHPSLLGFKDAWLERGHLLCMLTEFCNGGELTNVQRQAGGRNIAPEFIYGWFAQLARATQYLHARGVVHRDIKASNIFFYGPKLVKLGDFGLACRLDNDEDMDPAEFCGTPQYMCPDRLHERPYDERTDLWALGCLFYELSSLRRAYDMPANARTPRAALAALKKRVSSPEGPPPLPKVYAREWRDLIRGLLSRDAADRPELRDVLIEPFLERAVRETEEAFDEECAARPLPEPHEGPGGFVLRALEATAAAQTKAANLPAETLAACRAERRHVSEERAAEKKAEEKKQGMRAPGLAVKAPQLRAGRKSEAGKAAAAVTEQVAARVAAATESRAAAAAALGAKTEAAREGREALKEARVKADVSGAGGGDSTHSTHSRRWEIASSESSRSSRSAGSSAAADAERSGVSSSDRRGGGSGRFDSGFRPPSSSAGRPSDRTPDRPPDRPTAAAGPSASLPIQTAGPSSSGASSRGVRASYEVRVSSRATTEAAAAAAAAAPGGVRVPRVANLIPTAGSRRSKFMADVKPRTHTGRYTAPPSEPSRPSRQNVNVNVNGDVSGDGDGDGDKGGGPAKSAVDRSARAVVLGVPAYRVD